MTVLVTGANGFVGRWVVQALLAKGHNVVGASGPAVSAGAAMTDAERKQVRWLALDLVDQGSVQRVVADRYDAVVHLAGLASGGDALRDPGAAWAINAAGTARLLDELGRRRAAGGIDPVVIVASTAEVYGKCDRALVESDGIAPCSPYAASKRGAELAAEETARRTGLRVIVTRAFPHTGPGQDTRFVAPAFAERLRTAKRIGARCVNVGNLEVTRDFLDVRDVADAYVALIERGVAGETYNVASGTGTTLQELFERIATIVGIEAIPEADTALLRPADLPYLVGNSAKLRGATGWAPRVSLDDTLKDLVHAQTV